MKRKNTLWKQFPMKKWCGFAPSPGDISKNIILESGTNVNGGVHRDMCLRGKFLPLIGEKYPNSGCLSWTDPTVAHYARDTAQFLEGAGLATLKGDDTPPKVTQLRPIRDFWGVLKQDVYRGGSVASSEAQQKTNNRNRPEENRPRGAAHDDEGVSVCTCAPQTAMD